MLNRRPIDRLVKACTIALALAPTCLHADSFTQINLVSNVPGLAAVTDPNLRNPWGLSFNATSPFWVSNQAAGNATLYNGSGAITPLVVTIPAGSAPSGPTGTVFNSATAGFNAGTTKSNFIFDTLNGTIAAWNNAAGSTAIVEATLPGAVFTGVTQANVGTTTYLYAANSASVGGGIDVYDSNWNNVTATTFAGKFANPNPALGAVPFNIQQIGANLYVTYANLGPTGNALPGGYVVEYDASGNVLQVISSGPFAAPWGITLAPSNFGSFSNDLLIGQFGSGQILAYNPITDAFISALDDSSGNPIVNRNLWALDIRTGGTGDNLNAVYFTAGINNQQNGLFGEITEVPEPATIIETASGLLALATWKIRSRRR